MPLSSGASCALLVMQSTQKTSHCHKGKKPIEGGILINLELSGWQIIISRRCLAQAAQSVVLA
jgi:hypothetical protein